MPRIVGMEIRIGSGADMQVMVEMGVAQPAPSEARVNQQQRRTDRLIHPGPARCQ